MKYFPDIGDNHVPDRAFMWTVLGTLKYEACQQLLKDARKARSLETEENKDDLIEIHPEFLERLLATPLLPKGGRSNLAQLLIDIARGRESYLLKSSRPQRIARNRPKEYDANLNLLTQNEIQVEEPPRPQVQQEDAKDQEEPMNVDRKGESEGNVNRENQQQNQENSHDQLIIPDPYAGRNFRRNN